MILNRSCDEYWKMNIDEIKNLAASFVVNKNKFDRLPEIKFHDSSSGKRFLLFFFSSERIMKNSRKKWSKRGSVCKTEEKFACLSDVGNSRNAMGSGMSFVTQDCEAYSNLVVRRDFFQWRIPRVAAPLYFPNRYSLLAGVMVDTLCPWYTRPLVGRRVGERGSWCEIALEGVSPLFVPSTTSKRQDCNKRSDILYIYIFFLMTDGLRDLFLFRESWILLSLHKFVCLFKYLEVKNVNCSINCLLWNFLKLLR